MHHVDELLEMVFLKQFDTSGSVPVGSVRFDRETRIGRHGRCARLGQNAHVLTVGVHMIDVTKAW